MLPPDSPLALMIFAGMIALLLGACLYRGRGGRGAGIVHAMAFGGDYLAIGVLGVCGLVAQDGYDGFLFGVGALTGLFVALFLFARPVRRLGALSLAGAVAARFNARGVTRFAAIATLVVAVLFVVPLLAGAGALLAALFNLPFAAGVAIAGALVLGLAAAANRAATAWVCVAGGAMLLVLCGTLTAGVVAHGFSAKPPERFPRVMDNRAFAEKIAPMGTRLYPTGAWAALPYVRIQLPDGSISTWRVEGQSARPPTLLWPSKFTECQTLTITRDGKRLVDGLPEKSGNALRAAGFVAALPDDKAATGPLGLRSFLVTFMQSDIGVPAAETVTDADGSVTRIYDARVISGGDFLALGNHPTLFPGIESHATAGRLNLASFMLALLCGAAALPQMFRRAARASSEIAARRSAVVGIAAVAVFYILSLYLGLGALALGTLDAGGAGSASTVPLLAGIFGGTAMALASALAFLAALGAAAGLVRETSAAVARDLPHAREEGQTEGRAGRGTKGIAIAVGLAAGLLAAACRDLNVAFLAAWAFNVAASTLLPALAALLCWKGATRQGIAASMGVGLASSLLWILNSSDAYASMYHHPEWHSLVPFSQPALVTIPLACLTLAVVSLLTGKGGDGT